MSVEDDMRADLLAHAPLVALVTKIAPDKVEQGQARPFIVYLVEREPIYGLETLATTRYEFTFQCWGDTRAQAEAVADALEAALALATTVDPSGIPTETRSTAFDPDTGLEAVNVTVDVWKDAA